MSDIHKQVIVVISTIGCFILCIFGVYRLIVEYPDSLFIPLLFAICGLIGLVGGMIELRKNKGQ